MVAILATFGLAERAGRRRPRVSTTLFGSPSLKFAACRKSIAFADNLCVPYDDDKNLTDLSTEQTKNLTSQMVGEFHLNGDNSDRPLTALGPTRYFASMNYLRIGVDGTNTGSRTLDLSECLG